MSQRKRLDQVLVERGLARSRAQARDMIKRGHVRIAGEAEIRPAAPVQTEEIEVTDPAARYVSRSALKLIAGLNAFGFDPTGLTVLDLGASTGGFSQVLLERGAARIHAVDVGHDQLAEELRCDPRVIVYEGVNARDLQPDDLGERVQAMTADLSFISLRLVLPAVLPLMADASWLVFLVKPQFEVGREFIGKGGRVTDAGVRETSVAAIADMLRERHWRVDDPIASPIPGGDGNMEFLLGGRRL